jgi:hypothetical protein
MTLGLLFWILMAIWLIFGILSHFGMVAGVYAVSANAVLLFVLFLLLGWATFGPPLHR